jgi:putative aldouronate transport system permease protein
MSIFSQQTGVINTIIKSFGGQPYPFMYQDGSWLAILIGAGIWKEAGFSSIIYLAALTNIDQQLYEAASLDGANKWQQIKRITLPSIAPTISIMLILAMGGAMDVGFELIYTFSNDAVSRTSEVISTYIYRRGMQGGQFSLTTAMGLFESVVGLTLVLISNRIAKAFDQSLW